MKKTFVTLEKVHVVIVKEFVKNIIVITIYKEYESQYTQTQEMEIDWIIFLYVMIEVDNTDDMMIEVTYHR